MLPRGEWRPLGLASGLSLAIVSFIDFYTAKSLSLVAFVEPGLVGVVQVLEMGLSVICAIGVVLTLVTWPFLHREAHRKLTLVVLSIQTVGLLLDVLALLMTTLFGKHANPFYLLLEAAMVHVATVQLFTVWYATLDHHRQAVRELGGPEHRQRLTWPQHSARYPGYENWVPGFIDYYSFAFTVSSCLAPAEAMPLAAPVKLLVMTQVTLALIILLVLAARAIGLIV
jgi:hypothetical protein